jgi:hypothetical protein
VGNQSCPAGISESVAIASSSKSTAVIISGIVVGVGIGIADGAIVVVATKALGVDDTDAQGEKGDECYTRHTLSLVCCPKQCNRWNAKKSQREEYEKISIPVTHLSTIILWWLKILRTAAFLFRELVVLRRNDPLHAAGGDREAGL